MDDPVACTIYAKNNNLLEVDGWKQFKHIAKREEKLQRMVNQAKLRSYNTSPKYIFGYEVPKNYEHAMRLDLKYGSTRWREAVSTEMGQLHEYNTFKTLGHKDDIKTMHDKLDGYKRIKTHLVFDVKHDGCHKARMVADGHLTDVPLTSVYSGVVSLCGLHLQVFLAELNGLEMWTTDIGNAYLEAETDEKVYIIAGPEFGEL